MAAFPDDPEDARELARLARTEYGDGALMFAARGAAAACVSGDERSERLWTAAINILCEEEGRPALGSLSWVLFKYGEHGGDQAG